MKKYQPPAASRDQHTELEKLLRRPIRPSELSDGVNGRADDTALVRDHNGKLVLKDGKPIVDHHERARIKMRHEKAIGKYKAAGPPKPKTIDQQIADAQAKVDRIDWDAKLKAAKSVDERGLILLQRKKAEQERKAEEPELCAERTAKLDRVWQATVLDPSVPVSSWQKVEVMRFALESFDNELFDSTFGELKESMTSVAAKRSEATQSAMQKDVARRAEVESLFGEVKTPEPPKVIHQGTRPESDLPRGKLVHGKFVPEVAQ
jgi:hypothetical protein